MKKYTWEEQETYWGRRYSILSKESGLAINTIISARRIILGAFGESWLKTEYQKISTRNTKSNATTLAAPSIVRLFTNPTVNSAVQMVELSKYISLLAKTEGINDVIQMLRSESHFEDARLNIAMAYRFSMVGVNNLVLEPDTPRGKGDFKGEIYGEKLFAECTVLKDKNLVTYFAELVMSRVEKGLKDKQLNVAIEVEFLGDIDNDAIDNIVASVRQARHEFGNFKLNPSFEEKKFQTEHAVGRVYQMNEEQKSNAPDMKKWDVAFGISHATPAEPNNVYSIDLDNQKRSGMLFIKGLGSVEDTKPYHERVKVKLESKLVQSHGIDTDVNKFFIVMLEKPVERADWDSVWKEIYHLLKDRPYVAGLMLVDRRQTLLEGKCRYAYPLIFFQSPYSQSQKLPNIFPSLEILERSDWVNNGD